MSGHGFPIHSRHVSNSFPADNIVDSWQGMNWKHAGNTGWSPTKDTRRLLSWQVSAILWRLSENHKYNMVWKCQVGISSKWHDHSFGSSSEAFHDATICFMTRVLSWCDHLLYDKSTFMMRPFALFYDKSTFMMRPFALWQEYFHDAAICFMTRVLSWCDHLLYDKSTFVKTYICIKNLKKFSVPWSVNWNSFSSFCFHLFCNLIKY
jgi:hypothetical protein